MKIKITITIVAALLVLALLAAVTFFSPTINGTPQLHTKGAQVYIYDCHDGSFLYSAEPSMSARDLEILCR